MLFKKLYPEHRREEIENCIVRAAEFIEKIQATDGSWYGSWGVCFTYAGWFGIKGLITAGRTYEDCSSISKACDFLLSKELASGGWGESYICHVRTSLPISLSPWPLLMLPWQVSPGFGYWRDYFFCPTGPLGQDGCKTTLLGLRSGLLASFGLVDDWKSWPPEVRRWWPARAVLLA
ncbi:hypothetical protein ACLB2K_072589 [Fragaria x ananassa]